MQTKRVLIVEEDRDLADLIGESLAGAGLSVVLAHDKRQAIKVLQLDGPFDAAVIDVYLDRTRSNSTGGIGVIEMVRKLERQTNTPKAHRLPIIAISGSPGLYGASHALAVADMIGANETISTPFSPDVLLSCIEALTCWSRRE